MSILIAVAKTEGPTRGLDWLDAIESTATADYQPYWSARAHLLERIGRLDDARDAYDRAIGLAEEDGVRRWLLAKKLALEAATSPAGKIRKGS